MGHYYHRELAPLAQARCRYCRAILCAGFVLPVPIDASCTECAEEWFAETLPVFARMRPRVNTTDFRRLCHTGVH